MMKMKREVTPMQTPLKLALVCAVLSFTTQHADSDERPRWMSPEAGWVDEETDTRVEKVTRNKEDGTYKVEISVPKVDKPIEEVLVVGTQDPGPEYQLPVRYEVINDLDSGRSGIILYMGTDDEFALQINYDEGTPQKAVPRDPGLNTR
jgi:hypothetical protein